MRAHVRARITPRIGYTWNRGVAPLRLAQLGGLQKAREQSFQPQGGAAQKKKNPQTLEAQLWNQHPSPFCAREALDAYLL